MRVNANLFWILGAFFLASAILYTVWSILDRINVPDGQYQLGSTPVEWVGTVGITLTAVLSFFIAFYLTITRRAQGGELPEDSLTAGIDDGDPEIGQFSPWSWWPMFLAFGLAFMFLGLAIGTWLAFIGGPLAVIAIIGWQYEYYRGFFAR